jgi:hypothetical protein
MEKKLLGQKEIIRRCLNNNRQAQFELYEKYSPAMFGVCLRYAKNSTDAEDILQEGFIKVFRYLKDFTGRGSFEGWLRRIMVNSALNFYKRKNLISKGVGMGTAIALIIGGAGMAIPEMTMLAKIFKRKLLISFIGVIFLVAVITGYAFNIIM